MKAYKLFTPEKVGSIEVKNRIVMSPMTRCRAIGNTPNELMAEYYRQRSGAGLIITEGTAPSPNGLGYARIPGIYSNEQVQGWKKVTSAVHQAGGKIVVQLGAHRAVSAIRSTCRKVHAYWRLRLLNLRGKCGLMPRRCRISRYPQQ
ncbi:MAG: hypothetical protein U0Z17_00590 [Bacteroidales bacterium]